MSEYTTEQQAILRDGSPEATAYETWLDAEYEKLVASQLSRNHSFPGVTPMQAFYAGWDIGREALAREQKESKP